MCVLLPPWVVTTLSIVASCQTGNQALHLEQRTSTFAPAKGNALGAVLEPAGCSRLLEMGKTVVSSSDTSAMPVGSAPTVTV